ncbi:heme NO-binding domain-containing protein [Natronolimnohabitans innermongolicus]|uniref:Heme NO binding domain protein n=1 Tax=Natronolimnohabitans innermongolicus JCM 12255 TaxID=1227499 RepID=L9WZL1_9EURY|nr:heme NO-binding domain-containing protein [Natronolimnohabitans innermongolicus]ELY54832.1 Heme NO binding domain protein [Natronolimnohabitans innermongolicus JCM 12255]
MHGIVHKTLKEYVVSRTDEDTWETVLERAGIEPRLYLPVTTYADDEIDAILATLSSMATQNRAQIERDFGRTLAPELRTTFTAHIRDDDCFAALENLAVIVESVDASSDETALPTVTGRREGADRVRVTYRTHREPTYCGLARGLLEGFVATFDDAGAEATTVTKVACVEDGGDACVFFVERERDG